MKKYPLIQTKAAAIGFGVFLCAILFFCRDSMFCMGYLGFYPSQFLTIGLIGALVLAFLWVNRKDARELVRDPRVPWAAICGLIILLPMVIKRDWQLMYFSILLAVYLSIFLTFFLTVEETARYYLVMLSALSVYSLITTYILRIFADNGMLVPPKIYRTPEIDFYNYFFSFVSVWFVKNRNYGIYREPGVHQYFLILGLYLNNYHVTWKKPATTWIVNAILAVTMLSTFATGGVIEMGLFVIVLYFDKQWHRTRKGRILGLAAVGVFLLAVAVIVLQHGELYMELFRMLEKFGNGSDSITDRIGSPIVNAQFLLAAPLWGGGIYDVLHAIENNTSSSTILYAILGLVGGTLNVVSWFALVWDKKHTVIANLALLAILAMAFNTQNLITDPFFWMFPFMALTERALPLLEKKGRTNG